jgi:histidinol phosphatase-like enzyme
VRRSGGREGSFEALSLPRAFSSYLRRNRSIKNLVQPVTNQDGLGYGHFTEKSREPSHCHGCVL